MGVPTLACTCAVCTSTDAHDRRLRPSALLRWREPETDIERVVVIDTGPDFREQALNEKLTHVDAVFYTHAHADHILGMDDLRPLSFIAAAAGRTDSALCGSERRRRFWSTFFPTLFRRTPRIPRGRAWS